MDRVYRIISQLGEVPWMINKDILKVVDEAWQQDLAIATIPPKQNLPLPEVPEVSKEE